MYYVMIGEMQMLENFDVHVTGSNAKFLFSNIHYRISRRWIANSHSTFII
jgi:hypothetical protein